MCLILILAGVECAAPMLLNSLNLLEKGRHTQQIYKKCLMLTLKHSQKTIWEKTTSYESKACQELF